MTTTTKLTPRAAARAAKPPAPGQVTIGSTNVILTERGPDADTQFERAVHEMLRSCEVEPGSVNKWSREASFPRANDKSWILVLERKDYEVPGIGTVFLTVNIGSKKDALPLIANVSVGIQHAGCDWEALSRDFSNRGSAQEYFDSLLNLMLVAGERAVRMAKAEEAEASRREAAAWEAVGRTMH